MAMAVADMQFANVDSKCDQRNFPIQKRSPASILNYAFDKNGQLLTQSEVNEQNSVVLSSPRNENFSYDEIGNRSIDKYGNLVSKLSKDISKDSFNYSYSSKNQLIEVVPT